MLVKEIMTTPVVHVEPSSQLSEITDLMKKHRISCLVVCQHEMMVGIITERDLTYASRARERGEAIASTAHELMSSPVISVNADDRVHTAAGMTQQLTIRHLPVTDSAGQLVGITTQTDLLRCYLGELEELVSERTQELTAVAEKLKQGAAAKGQFLANMSHEIRTPMTAILGFVDLMSEEQISPEERRSHLDIVHRNSMHLMNIINDILDLSKIESGAIELEVQPTSPSEIMTDISLLMRNGAVDKGLAFAVEYDGRIPELFPTDPTRLRQILMNLLSNAIKFTREGGVRVIVGLLGDPDSGEGRLRFEVVDTGCGLTAAQRERLFTPFMQADMSTTRTHGGTGLGLSISCKLAELMGGCIEVRSQVGKGSSFILTLPAGPLEGVELVDGQSSSVLAEHRSAESLVRLSGRVLIAEDVPDSRMLVRRLLKRAGLEVEEAENGQIALNWALESWRHGEPFDLILMDMQMPELDGYQATRRLRAEGYDGPVIALTSYALSGDRKKCIDAGCDAYATKPVDRVALLALLADYLTKPRNEE